MTAAPGLVPCKWVISSSSGNVLANLPSFNVLEEVFQIGLPSFGLIGSHLSNSFTLEIRVFGCYSWQTSISITAMALDIACAVVLRSARAIDGIFSSFKKRFPACQLSYSREGSRQYRFHSSTVFIFMENAASHLKIKLFLSLLIMTATKRRLFSV